MIFKRVYANLRAQHWTAILIELAIVIVGVFIGTWVANWNQQRADKRSVERLIEQLQPKLRELAQLATDDQGYYAVVGRYARVAHAGWARDPAVTDDAFVIAAFQATELSPFNNNPLSGDAFFSAEEVRRIEDVETRERLTTVQSYDSQLLDLLGEGSEYREAVRSIIPTETQQLILAECGDRYRVKPRRYWLPATCQVKLPPKVAVSTAAALRAHPELVRALTSHMAHVTRHVTSAGVYGMLLRRLDERITETRQ